ncbi:hypothetical protein [Pseudodesulfovibrio sp. zrk46]|uniref:hypothetical protein n=1 Tax=Pseudodesulfovibrio sp. zrk46 TaxID=2725288 RepID=UPI0014497409|nr:hypothetical protein [Pseudodesulfovibrio sp. zrk46]QJB57428.1 hypothetical protein HFN16_13890 [Pseudodesulfovibrio sp. zrk46]
MLQFMSMENRNDFTLPYDPYDSNRSPFTPQIPKTCFHTQSLATYLMSALFRAEYMAGGDFVHAMPIPTLCSKKELLFTGERFDQWDLDVLLYCALNSPVKNGTPLPFQFGPANLLHSLGMRNTILNRQRVSNSLRKLHNGVVEIIGSGYRYMTRFIDRVLVDSHTERLIVETNGDVVTTFRTNEMSDCLQIRKSLRNNGLAKWLHGATLVYKGGLTATHDSLHSLSCPKVRTAHLFNTRLDKALDLLEKTNLVEVWSSNTKIQIISRVVRSNEGSCGLIHL